MQEPKMILGMIMLADDNSFDMDRFVVDFKSQYDGDVQDATSDNTSFGCTIDRATVAVGFMPFPIPAGDIEGTAQYGYNWPDALAEIVSHKAHLIVTLMQEEGDQVKCFMTFTRVICSLLRTTNSIGVYKGNQSLLIPKDDYLNEAELMGNDYLPLNLWIYFGLQVTDMGNSGYTYGLTAFDKHEMEVLNSSKSLEEIRGLLFNMAYYVVENNVAFKDGDTCGLSAEERISISFSKGKLVEGKTFKLAY